MKYVSISELNVLLRITEKSCGTTFDASTVRKDMSNIVDDKSRFMCYTNIMKVCKEPLWSMTHNGLILCATDVDTSAIM